MSATSLFGLGTWLDQIPSSAKAQLWMGLVVGAVLGIMAVGTYARYSLARRMLRVKSE